MFKTVSSYFRKTFKTSQCQVVTFTLSLSLLRPCTSRPLHWSLATAFEVKMQPLSVSRYGTWMLCGCCIAGCSSGNSLNFLEGLPGSLVTLVTYSTVSFIILQSDFTGQYQSMCTKPEASKVLCQSGCVQGSRAS